MSPKRAKGSWDEGDESQASPLPLRPLVLCGHRTGGEERRFAIQIRGRWEDFLLGELSQLLHFSHISDLRPLFQAAPLGA